MSIHAPKAWITGEELGKERRSLLAAGLDDDSPEMQALWKQVDERDDYLWERYAKPLIGVHPGEWAAVSLGGEVLRGPASVEVHQAARDRFGPGNFAYGKLAEFRGIDLARC